MASSNETQVQGPETQLGAGGSESGSDPEELERLEMEVKEMAQRILHYRATLPDQLKETLASVLAAQRPPVLPRASDPLLYGDPIPGQIISNNGALLAERDLETAKKIQLLKAKIADNVSHMPFVLKRMKECISKIDQLDSQNNRIIHPAFKGKRLADKDVALA